MFEITRVVLDGLRVKTRIMKTFLADNLKTLWEMVHLLKASFTKPFKN